LATPITGIGDRNVGLQMSRNSLGQRVGARETPFVEPVRSYVICCVQRTGSWLLAHTLADTGYAGRPSDYFDDAERENHTREWGLPAADLTAYVQAMRDKATTPNGVLGSKLMWNDFDSRAVSPWGVLPSPERADVFHIGPVVEYGHAAEPIA
jgi:hypothetical protein